MKYINYFLFSVNMLPQAQQICLFNKRNNACKMPWFFYYEIARKTYFHKGESI